MVVVYTPGDGSSPLSLDRVDDASQCVPNGFYVEDDLVTLCPDACVLVGDDEEGGELNIVPFLDIIVNILIFVLATVAVTFTATITTTPPARMIPR